MPLDPFFFQMPQFDDPRRPKVSRDNGWRVIGFSQYAEWTLVHWRVDVQAVGPKTVGQIYTVLEPSSFDEGETLYAGTPPNHRHIASASYRLSFYEPTTQVAGPTKVTGWGNTFDFPAWSAGAYGVPVAVARALHDPNNYIAFEA